MNTWNETLKYNLATICLMVAMFFNPFGFDIVQWWLVQQTGSLWKANAALYCIAGLFFRLSILFRPKNKKSDKIN